LGEVDAMLPFLFWRVSIGVGLPLRAFPASCQPFPAGCDCVWMGTGGTDAVEVEEKALGV
jgi:hypothetical protein